MSQPTIHVTDTLDAVAGPLIADAITGTIAGRGSCRLALSGGGTPGPTLGALAHLLSAASYRDLWITWVDERHLPHNGNVPGWLAHHPDTNIRMAYECWLAGVTHLEEQVLPMTRGLELQQDLEAFQRGFAVHFQNAVDVVLLGVGPDGHIGSLFPGHPALETTGSAAAISNSPKPPAERITLTFEVIEAASTVVLLAAGADKADVLAAAQRGDTSIPLGRLRCQGDVHWVLDGAAASKLAST